MTIVSDAFNRVGASFGAIIPSLYFFGCIAIICEVLYYRFYRKQREQNYLPNGMIYHILRYVFFLYLLMVFNQTGMRGAIWHLQPINPDRIYLIPFTTSPDPMPYIHNVLMTIPLGFLLPLLWPSLRRLWKVTLFGLSMSFLIEFMQLFSHRVTSTSDLLMNTLGAVIGYLLFYAVYRWVIGSDEVFKIAKCKTKLLTGEARTFLVVAFLGAILLYIPRVSSLLPQWGLDYGDIVVAANFNDSFVSTIPAQDVRVNYKLSTPRVYIFNSHPLEMINSPSYNLFVGDMRITELSYILADYLKNQGIESIVETRCVDKRLHLNNWEFYMSYYAARAYLLDAMNHYPSLELFIDLHRDGIPRRYATTEINGLTYARILFVIGTDNPNGYYESYQMARQLHAMLEEIKPGISRGLFFSGGAGRDGVYSQDISPQVKLIELGTYSSTVDEATRSVAVLAEVLANYLKD